MLHDIKCNTCCHFSLSHEVTSNFTSSSRYHMICVRKNLCVKCRGLTGLHDSPGSWHLYICRFLYGLSVLLSLHSCYEGHSVLFCKKKIEPLDRVMANIKRSFPMLSACRFVEFYTSIICHVLVHCFDSFLLQDIFLDLQEFAFEGQNMTFTVNVLLTCIPYCDAGPGYD